MDGKFRICVGLAAVASYFLVFHPPGIAQTSSAVPAPQSPPKRIGGFVPGQERSKEDPVRVAHGKTLYDVNCRACHGADLRGGDMGGPNLLRSQVALSDKAGELIVPIIHGSRQKQGMPAIGINDDDAGAVAAYVRSVIATIGVQGMPPPGSAEAPNVLVGDAREGKAYFAAKCAGCHNPTGDLAGIAARITDPKILQTRWVGAGRRSERRNASGTTAPAATATVSTPAGEVTGTVVHIDDFLVTLKQSDGSVQSFRRDGDNPKVEIKDPIQAHRELLPQYTDKDIHDVTAYLVTLK